MLWGVDSSFGSFFVDVGKLAVYYWTFLTESLSFYGSFSLTMGLVGRSWTCAGLAIELVSVSDLNLGVHSVPLVEGRMA